MAESSLKMSASVKQFFFDRSAVQDALGKAEAKNLSRLGAFIRQRARSLLRRRKGTASPGQPPSVHSASSFYTLKNIQFSYEQSKHAMIVGPIKVNTPANADLQGSISAVPQLMEFGGNIVSKEERWKGSKGQWFHRDARHAAKNSKEYRSRIARYTPHPFMEKALEIEIQAGSIRDIWRASIGTGI